MEAHPVCLRAKDGREKRKVHKFIFILVISQSKFTVAVVRSLKHQRENKMFLCLLNQEVDGGSSDCSKTIEGYLDYVLFIVLIRHNSKVNKPLPFFSSPDYYGL